MGESEMTSIAKLVGAAVVLAGTASLVAPPSVGAGATTVCHDGLFCLSRNTGGGGEMYEFASADGALNNNSYSPSGTQVSDHNLSTRMRDRNFQRACVYADFNYSGQNTGNAPYSGAAWVTNVNELGSSIRRENSACD